jgi:hypothetical protein
VCVCVKFEMYFQFLIHFMVTQNKILIRYVIEGEQQAEPKLPESKLEQVAKNLQDSATAARAMEGYRSLADFMDGAAKELKATGELPNNLGFLDDPLDD